jgi:hypothetical protein
MTIRVNVTNGTNAGHRVVREQRTEPWTCECGTTNRHYWARCPECSKPRP